MAKKPQPQTVGIFFVDNDAVFPWTIPVFMPDPKKPGEKLRYKLPVEFRHVSPERRLEILADWRERELERMRIGDTPADDDEVQVLKDIVSFERCLLNEAVVRFPGVLDKNKEVLPDTDETKQLVLSNAWAVSAALPSYKQFLIGHSAEGN